MPTFNGITISLQSQYDALPIPEHPLSNNVPLRTVSNSPVTTIDVAIPACSYSSSQFWLTYDCSSAKLDCRCLYLKLVIGDTCVVSWGTDEQQGWSGKVMFGLFDGRRDFEGRKVLEKRGFFFRADAEEWERGLEVRVYRAKAKRRERVGCDVNKGAWEGFGAEEGGVSLVPIGRVQRGEPRRYYAYALLDAVDEPYVRFRYHFSTTAPADARESSDDRLSFTLDIDGKDERQQTAAQSVRPSRRLSFPPRTQLRSSTMQSEPYSPVKKAGTAAPVSDIASEQTHNSKVVRYGDVFERDDWEVRTPSPVIANRDRLERASTPPAARTKDGSIALLRGVIANALKRREGSRDGTFQ